MMQPNASSVVGALEAAADVFDARVRELMEDMARRQARAASVTWDSVLRLVVPYHYVQTLFEAEDVLALLVWYASHVALFVFFFAFANPIYCTLNNEESFYSGGILFLSYMMFCMAMYHFPDAPELALHSRDMMQYFLPALSLCVPVLLAVDILLRMLFRRTLAKNFHAFLLNVLFVSSTICVQYAYCISTHPLGRSGDSILNNLARDGPVEATCALMNSTNFSTNLRSVLESVAKNGPFTTARSLMSGPYGSDSGTNSTPQDLLMKETVHALLGQGSWYCNVLDAPLGLPGALVGTLCVLGVWSAVFKWICGRGFLLVDVVTKDKKPQSADGFGPLEDTEAVSEQRVSSMSWEEQPTMCPWYTTALVHTIGAMIVQFKVFLGRFDARCMRAAVTTALGSPDRLDRRFVDRDELWFDFVADTGDGFHSTYTIARSLAQPRLNVSVPNETHRLSRRAMRRSVQRLASSASSTLRKINGLKSGSKDDHSCQSQSSGAASNNSDHLPFMRSVSQSSLPGLKPEDGKDGPAAVTMPFGAEALFLPRGELLLHGGDLAYPQPSLEVYEQRLIRPYEAALSAPLGVDPTDVSCHQRAANSKIAQENGAPLCWMIPGNHDWFDGLETFLHTICGRHWFAGWQLPQTSTYWSLALPHNWYVFGVDLGLNDDLDDVQYTYFHSIVMGLPADASVIAITHAPHWHWDNYHRHQSGRMYRHLLGILGDKLRMLLAGDVHHYSRYTPSQPGGGPELVISGGGGAFLHPTHVPVKVAGYRYASCYPSQYISRAFGLLNPFEFRRRNWAFEIVLGVLYVLMVISAMPLCGHTERALAEWRGGANFAKVCFELVVFCYVRICEDTVVALVTQIGVFLVCIGFAEAQWGKRRRFLWGCGLGVVNPLMAVVLACACDLAFTAMGSQAENTPEPPMLLRNLPSPFDEKGIWVTQNAISFLDLPTHIFNAREAVCSAGPNPPRYLYVSYVLLVLPYFWILATPLSAFLFGAYLAFASMWGRHFDESFSSLRIQNFKNFLRMHIDKEGTLHLYAIGVDRVSTQWTEDPLWKKEVKAQARAPASRFTPSRWKPKKALKTKLVDHIQLPSRSQKKVEKKFSHARSASTATDLDACAAPWKGGSPNSRTTDDDDALSRTPSKFGGGHVRQTSQ
eukprot:TRINITY_DN51244_c0_g1_i1.p1 TRINITY_DN51244_c0_g1~~TRINITY_DN51244_c0_g1_i1.p1  ORF type:complete len:1150 (-),score=135.26 TRINITY_DN51244_c0_g1_i1:315-3764(-)